MVSKGTLANAINSDVVRLSIKPTSGADEFITVYDIEYSKEPPRNRISTRGGKLDTYGPPLEDIWASAVVDKTIFDLLVIANTQNARKKYPEQSITLKGESLEGTGSNDITITFQGEIPTLKILAPPGGIATPVRFHIIAK